VTKHVFVQKKEYVHMRRQRTFLVCTNRSNRVLFIGMEEEANNKYRLLSSVLLLHLWRYPFPFLGCLFLVFFHATSDASSEWKEIHDQLI